MKTLKFLSLTQIFLFTYIWMSAQTATEIVKKADDKMQGESNYSEMEMKIVRPQWNRTLSFTSCSKGKDYSITLITNPAKEKGQTFLKRKNELWSWNPTIERLIKLPPSMLSQGWMGSDYSNDDVLNESSVVNDYTHKIIGTETIERKDCYKIELNPKPTSLVVWGKQEMWITKTDFIILIVKYYDEDNYLVKTEKASQIKLMDNRLIPTVFEILPADEPQNKTLVTIKKNKFDISVDETFFSQQNMKKGENLKFPVQ